MDCDPDLGNGSEPAPQEASVVSVVASALSVCSLQGLVSLRATGLLSLRVDCVSGCTGMVFTCFVVNYQNV